MRLVLALVVAATAALAATAGPAYACSCAPPDPRSLLGQADGAFVGRLVSRQEVAAGRTRFTFAVERSVKGALGSTVVVESASNSAACGIETPVGSRIGLFLERRDGGWTSSLCWQVSPEDLLAAAQPLPPPNGRGPTTLLVAGRFGPARLLALDALGRTLAYGRGQGSVLQLSACPGGRRAAEVVQTATGVRGHDPRAPGAPHRPASAGCLSPPGTSLTVVPLRDGRRHPPPPLPCEQRPPRERATRATHALPQSRPLAGKRDRRDVDGTVRVRARRRHAARASSSVDLRTRRVRTVGRIPAPSNGLVAAPGGTELAGLTYPTGSQPALFRVRVQPVRRRDDAGRRVGRPLVRRTAAGSCSSRAEAAVRASTAPRSPSPRASRGRRTARPSPATTAYGVGAGGQLHRALLPAGPERVVRHLPGPSVSAIVPVR